MKIGAVGAAVAASVLTGACMSPVMTFGGGKSQAESQHDRLAELLPPQLAMDAKWRGAVATARIRVWADDDYRAQNVHWEQTFGEQLEYANAVLGPLVGVQLVADYRAWSYHPAPGATLADDLRVLADRDPGDDVLSVVGLVSSLSLVATAFEALGVATEPGNHVILRGYADLDERAAFGRAFPDLRADERESALEARRRHKTAVLLLHELGHNFGAPHDETPDVIMNPIYSDHAAAFSDASRARMVATLSERLHRGAPDVGAAAGAPARAGAAHTAAVHVHADGSVGDDGDKPIDELRAHFEHVAATPAQWELAVYVVPGAPAWAVAAVIDAAKAAGITRVSMMQR